MKFHVVIEKDEAGYFSAEVPILPGCFSQGNSTAEALLNIQDAIQLYLATRNDLEEAKGGYCVDVDEP